MRLIAALGCALAAVVAVPALATDLDCQFGLTAGSVFGRSQHVPEGGAPFSDNFNVNGRASGAEAGCLSAGERWRYGFFGDVMETNAQGSAQGLPPNQDAFVHTAFDWLGTLRGVIGYDFGSRLTGYVTGGVAATSVTMRLCKTSCLVNSQIMWGIAGGAGFQYRLLRRLSASVEYRFVRLENKPFPSSGAAVVGDHDVSVNPEAQLLLVGLHFHF